MSTVNDYKLAALKTLTGETVGTSSDLYHRWLAAETSMTGATIADMELSLLNTLGYTAGTVNDRWNAYLAAEGYVGTLNDKMLQLWAAGGPVLSASFLLLESGDFLLLESGDKLILES